MSILEAAANHKGAAFVEVYQNCNIFNDGAFDFMRGKEVRDDAASTWSTASQSARGWAFVVFTMLLGHTLRHSPKAAAAFDRTTWPCVSRSSPAASRSGTSGHHGDVPRLWLATSRAH